MKRCLILFTKEMQFTNILEKNLRNHFTHIRGSKYRSWQPPGYQVSGQTVLLSCWLVKVWNDIFPKQASKQSNLPGFTKIPTPSSCDSATPLLGIYLTEIPINMTNLDSVLKSRDITLPTKVFIVKPMVFPVVIYRCESWTIKKSEHQRIDAFELWYWRRVLRIP